METIKFSDWQKSDLRTAKILKVESVEGADKLYKIEIDLGRELGKRTLVAGLKPYYKPEQLKNKICIVFTNLEPKIICGIKSLGMLLASTNENKDGKETVRLLQPDGEIGLGSRVR